MALTRRTTHAVNGAGRHRGAQAGAGLARTVFIDKDGTLVEDVAYNADPALLQLRPAAAEALAMLAGAGYALVVVTNQSGIERGYFTRAQFAHVEAEIARQLREAAGVALLDIVLCPHAPAPDGTPRCPCRKPAPGMLLRAALTHRLDLQRSWMIGDGLDDVEAGRRAGCRTVLISNPHGINKDSINKSGSGETSLRMSGMRTPDARCEDWDEVARAILGSTTANAGSEVSHG